MADPVPWWRRRRPVVGVTVAALALAGAALAVTGGDDGRRLHSWKKGPLNGGSVTFVGLPVDLNAPFTYGGAGVTNISDKSAVLEAVRVRPALPDGIKIVGIQAVGPNRTTMTVNNERAYPSKLLGAAAHPLPGTVVPPEKTKAGRAGVDLVFGLEITKPGYFGFAQIDLDYRVGSKEYTVRLDHGILACAPRSAHPKGCNGTEFMKSLQREVGIPVGD